MRAKETGISTWDTNIEGVTKIVNLIDNNDSNDNDKSETPSLMDQYLSHDKDSDGNHNDDTDCNKNAINHILVSENSKLVGQEMVNQDDEDVINHISVAGNTHLGRQENG